jgi:hypothetical protein
MADYLATSRSNYFRVKDPTAFEEWCRDNSLDVWTAALTEDTSEISHAVAANDGYWPSQRWDENQDDFIDFDFAGELAAHLKDNEVAILMEVGHEKLRYVCGYAQAIRSDGRVVELSLRDIYDRAAAAFPGSNVTEATY